MFRRIVLLRACNISISFAVALLLLAGGCGGKAPPAQSSVVSPQSSDDRVAPPSSHLWVAPTSRSATPSKTTLDEALTDLDALGTPKGVDESVFAQLKAALREALTTTRIADVSSATTGGTPVIQGEVEKLASRPPIGPSNRVDDLMLIDNGDGTYTLTWSYRNVGDYNQDGIVSIMDITPLAVHFNEPADETNEWIDGNADGVINIADVTPLAAHFSVICAGYSIQAADTYGGTFNEIAYAPLRDATGEGRKAFAYELSSVDFGSYRVVPSDLLGLEGAASNQAPLRPLVRSVSPLSGAASSEVTFTAAVSGLPPMEYFWDFDGGATPGTSNDISPTVILGDPGEYSCSLTVFNVLGEDTYAFTLTVTETTRGDWWMFGREPTHNRRSPYLGAQSATIKWHYWTRDCLFSSPAIGADGTVYVGSFDFSLHALNPDGSLKWSYQTGNRVASSPTIGVDGTIYAGSLDHYLYAFNPDGTLKWRFETGGMVVSSPAIDADGSVYVGSTDYYIYAINPDGTLKWRYQTGDEVQSSPAIAADGTIFVGSNDGYFYAVNPDGSLKWRCLTGYSVYSAPAIGTDGTIYVGSDGLCAFNPDGSLKWHYQTEDLVWSGPGIATDGSICVGSNDGYLYAITPEGALKWRFETGGMVVSSPAIDADGSVYVGSTDYYIYAINPDGSLKWRYQTVDEVRSSPAIDEDGTVYVGSYDGYLYAFGD